ncbi:outer membrane protein assembly factor BamA [Aggregicoccus sp. 17bor-14]|nr:MULTISPECIES: outer membrane protein assembly factor BamA [Myxococcaceae]MBF5046332.1 outer membrane protein assembly factor BamA [Simulacricoccus sp. 17bor-14]MRI92052.1 outer membrane protein assembly factor BamA [Aggregicoccus sp. 17bor-14]
MRHTVLPLRSWLPLIAATLVSLAPVRSHAQTGADTGAPAPAGSDAGNPSAERVVQVRVEGNRRVEAEVVRRALKTRVGQPFDPSLTDDDLRAVWALGFFQDVQLLTQQLPTGGIAYVVRVSERPAVRSVKLEGNEELSDDDFKETLDIKPFSLLDMEAVQKNQKKVQEKYIEKGYFLAEVTNEIKPIPNENSVDVIFHIKEHAKVMVKEIRFIGAEKVSPDVLRDVMLTKEGGFLSFLTGEGTYREEMFQRDLAVIQGAYYDRGYINVKVDKPTVQMSADKRYIFITLRITEGEPYDISSIDFSGDLIVPKEKLASLMTSHRGERFNRTKLSQDIQAITDVYYDQGYAYANISPVTATDPEHRTVAVTFDAQKGKQVTIERIDIVGNTKTRDQVIRREMRVYEGELYSGTGMRRSKERITALGFFESVEVTQKPGSRDDLIVLQVEVREKATGTFQVGLGFSSVETFIFTAQVSQNNFLGWGQTVSASAQISGLRSLVQLSFFDPYFLDTNYLLSADFYRQQADYSSFVRNSTGGSVSLGRYLTEDINASLGYTLEFVKVSSGNELQRDVLANYFLDGTTSSARLSLTWDRRDNRLFPSKGFIHSVSAEFAPQFLGGSFLFARYSGYSRLYFPLHVLGAVFKTNATVGYIQNLDDTRPVPISELYYLGGINTVRGYFLRSISPTIIAGTSSNPDATVSKLDVGGDKQIVLNFELEVPILEKAGLRGVLFYDAGNAYAPNERFFQDKQDNLPLGMFHSVGFGIRWFSPVGPLRFEWGVPLTRRPEDDKLLFEFTIGNFF